MLSCQHRRYPGGDIHELMGVFGSGTRVTRVSSNNVSIAVEHQEPAEVLSQLGDTSAPQFTVSKSVTTVAASGVLVQDTGVLYATVLYLHFCRPIHKICYSFVNTLELHPFCIHQSAGYHNLLSALHWWNISILNPGQGHQQGKILACIT